MTVTKNGRVVKVKKTLKIESSDYNKLTIFFIRNELTYIKWFYSIKAIIEYFNK